MRISDWSSDVCSSDLWEGCVPDLFLMRKRACAAPKHGTRAAGLQGFAAGAVRSSKRFRRLPQMSCPRTAQQPCRPIALTGLELNMGTFDEDFYAPVGGVA